MDLLSIVFRGGWVMVPIALCSLIAVFIVVERFFVLHNVGQFMLKIRSIFRKGDINGVLNFCSQKDAPIANIIEKGLRKYDEGEEKVKEAIENAGRAEIYHLEKRLGLLATIAGIAPLVGFLGTVTGMIAAFRKIEMLGGNATPSDLAGGIWEALLTTAFGLVVGIHEMESSSTGLLDLLRSGSSGSVETQEVAVGERRSYSAEETFVRAKR